MSTQKTLLLNDSHFLAKGGVRDVYEHPEDSSKCIKITYNYERIRSVRREINYLKKYSRQGIPFTHLPKFHGYCNTNKGKGLIFDLIRDYDGNRSIMLSDHVANRSASNLSANQIVSLLKELYEHLIQHRIIVCDPAPNNLLVYYPNPDHPRLVIVDGIGNPHFLKIADYSTYFAHEIINKKWRKYVEMNVILKEICAETGYGQL